MQSLTGVIAHRACAGQLLASSRTSTAFFGQPLKFKPSAPVFARHSKMPRCEKVNPLPVVPQSKSEGAAGSLAATDSAALPQSWLQHADTSAISADVKVVEPPAPAPAPPAAKAVDTVHKSSSFEDLEALRALILRVKAAQEKYETSTQEQVDAIFKQAALAANAERIPLARLATQETRMGVLEDKVIKNHFASEMIYNKYKNEKTCGVVEDDSDNGIQKIAEPIGVIAGVVPTTNPTSTAIFKCLIALKTRNGIILSPHPRAAKATIAAAKVVLDAAVSAGAPKDIIGWIEQPTLGLTQALMGDPDVKLILATGGPAMVHAAYSSGHPSIGVGGGNTPAVIDDTADVEMAVSSILISKTFDNGVICASEQSVVVCDAIYDKIKAEFQKRGAHFLDEKEKETARKVILKDGKLNADIVGQSVQRLSELFKIKVPKGCKVIIAEADKVGREEAWSFEKLSPLLAMYRAKDFEHATQIAQSLIQFAGPGHTSVLYTNRSNSKNINLFQSRVKTVRILVNTPASQGAIGDLYNFHLDPSLTLGCGSWGDTSVSANVAPRHLLNIKTVSSRRENMLWFRVPPKVYFKGGALDVALKELQGKQRAFIVTDKPLYNLGFADKVAKILDEVHVRHQVFYDVEPDPKFETVRRGLYDLKQFQPDVIIAIGGGSPMDAAKIMWLMYEHPEVKFEGLATRFMDIRKRVYDVPTLGSKAMLITIPTTSGTGSEVTPFSVVTDEKTGAKYPFADYALTPSMAIVDPDLVLDIPKGLTAAGGIDAITHALESYVSVCATEYTIGLSRESLGLLFKWLPASYKEGRNNYTARVKVHYGATIAGMAFANAFLGICHSMAHKLGAAFHIPHGIANALMISHVIRYNATDAPFKQAIFSQYEFPQAKTRYAEISDFLGFSKGATTEDEKVERLIEGVEEIKRQLDIPPTIREWLTKSNTFHEEDFYAKVDELAEAAFDDQCTGANPRYPLISDLKDMFIAAFEKPVVAQIDAEAGGYVDIHDD